MAASNYLLELDQRRERLISDVVTRLVRVPEGSMEHEVAVAFTARSLAYHDQLDAEAKKVIPSSYVKYSTICADSTVQYSSHNYNRKMCESQ